MTPRQADRLDALARVGRPLAGRRRCWIMLALLEAHAYPAELAGIMVVSVIVAVLGNAASLPPLIRG